MMTVLWFDSGVREICGVVCGCEVMLRTSELPKLTSEQAGDYIGHVCLRGWPGWL